MRAVAVGAVLVGVLGNFAVTTAQRKPEPPIRHEIAEAFGALPRPGDLADILTCAGSNEVFWIAAMRENPRDPEAHEARRKAGWYSAVALWVFQVDSTAVIDAVQSASRRDRSSVVAAARQCRKAPEGWRE